LATPQACSGVPLQNLSLTLSTFNQFKNRRGVSLRVLLAGKPQQK
jgi:hypothetical protein